MNEPSGLVLIENLEADPTLFSRFAEYEGVRSIAVVRLESHNDIVGILYVNYRHHHLFTDEDQDKLRMLGGQAAIAIRNARLMLENDRLITLRERDRLREDLHDALNTLRFKVMSTLEDIRDAMKQQGNAEAAVEFDRLWRATMHTYQHFVHILEDMRDPRRYVKSRVKRWNGSRFGLNSDASEFQAANHGIEH